MILILRSKADDNTLQQVAEDFEGYIKVVVDMEREILAAGGKLHSDAEKMLLADGSLQEHLWGGGLDLESGEIDYDSMINIRPKQGNPSREVLAAELRGKMDNIIRRLLR